MIKRYVSIILLIVLSVSQLNSYDKIYGELSESEKQVLNFGNNTCKNIKEMDIPTIFIPGILASWYSEEGYNETNVKRWIPDPITHSYDTLFYAFRQNGYSLKDVFYKDEFNTYIEGNPKQSLYLFGYDWKKDNKVTAKLLSNLVLQIRKKYEEENGCDIGTVNIIGHSMGGLVGRAMLEDMCALEKDYIAYYNDKKIKNGKLKDFEVTDCNNFTKINQFITIATPQRGSPSSFAIWEKGNIYQTESFVKGTILKGQLGSYSDDGLYQLIHGFDKSIPSGIVTIGQLLPDIENKNEYNSYLGYFKRDGETFYNFNYPKNSFLEELNKEKNIEKMFSKIQKNYTLYYSSITSNSFDWLHLSTKNNTIGFNIPSKYGLGSMRSSDKTINYEGLDIYGKYPVLIKENIYNVKNNITDDKGYGGDGTVPTRNLLLVSNDIGKTPESNKYNSVKIDCYNEDIFLKDYDFSKGIENKLTKKIGEKEFELCAHSKMPMLTSIKVFDKISGLNLIDTDLKPEEKIILEQQLLYSYLGYADYTKFYYQLKKGITPGPYGNNNPSLTTHNFIKGGIQNNDNIDLLFSSGSYNTVFEDKGEIFNFILFADSPITERKSLSFDGSAGQLDSLLRYEILSPINLIIEDEQGRKIGIDPETEMIINEIPGAWTSGDTEDSSEPEFFLIPKYGTGQTLHTIHSYGTGDGEYHIVMNEIKMDEQSGTGGQDEANFVIAGNATKGVVEDYLVGIEEGKANYKKIDSYVSDVLRKVELKEKYKDILEKLYKILDKKYTKSKKLKLKKRLIKFRDSGSKKLENNEKLRFLVDMIIEYIK